MKADLAASPRNPQSLLGRLCTSYLPTDTDRHKSTIHTSQCMREVLRQSCRYRTAVIGARNCLGCSMLSVISPSWRRPEPAPDLVEIFGVQVRDEDRGSGLQREYRHEARETCSWRSAASLASLVASAAKPLWSLRRSASLGAAQNSNWATTLVRHGSLLIVSLAAC